MNSPGTKNLGDVALAAINAATAKTVVTLAADAQSVNQPYIEGLDGMESCTLQANFTYGAGGTSIKGIVETSLDQGTTWIEVGRFAFTTSSAEKLFALLGAKEIVAALSPAALSDDTAISGVFGARWRASILTVGTYTGNTGLSFRLNAR